MYDVNGDGFITQDELLSLLSMMVGSNITPEQVANIIPSQLCQQTIMLMMWLIILKYNYYCASKEIYCYLFQLPLFLAVSRSWKYLRMTSSF